MKNYVKNNFMLIAFSLFVVIFIYAVRLFNYNIAIDTEAYLFNAKYYNSQWNIAEGRWGLSFFQLLFEGLNLRLNIFSANFLACSFLIASCLLWLALFRRYKNSQNIFAEIAFCLFYLSSKVWIEIICFTMMAAEVMFTALLCPVYVYIATESIARENKFYFLCAIALSVFIVSVYQPMIVLIFAGLLAVFILRSENLGACAKDLASIIIFAAASVIIYFAVNFIVLRLLNLHLDSYVTNQFGGGRSFKDMLILTGVYIYSLFFANNPLLNLILNPAIEFFSSNPLVSSFAHDGVSLIEHFHSRGLHGNSLFFPAVILFLIFAFRNKNVKNKFSFRVSSLLFLACAVVMAVAAGGVPAERHVHALPLVTSFLFFYTLCKIKNKNLSRVWLVLILIFGFYQAQTSSLLNVCDQKRYDMDKDLAKIIDTEIINSIGYSTDYRELVAFGDYPFYYGPGYIRGEVIGRSVLLWGSYVKFKRPAMFMNAHGYRYVPLKDSEQDKADGTRLEDLTNFAKTMPVYPEKGWVQEYNGVILVKFSE